MRPRRLGEHRVAVVLPTFTWQAYNFRDDDGDGDEDTWYADPARERSVGLGRPYENRGVPPHYKHYDQPFLRWLYHTGRNADYLTDSDLDRIGRGDTLARAYRLLLFPGHHEYVTAREYDAVERFRDLGGNLMFLSANNFYWRVDRRGSRIERIRALAGARAPGSGAGRCPVRRQRLRRASRRVDRAEHDVGAVALLGPRAAARRPLLERRDRARHDGAELTAGDGAARRDPESARARHQRAHDVLRDAEGARVFAAGAFTLAGSVWQPDVSRLMENLWARLARER